MLKRIALWVQLIPMVIEMIKSLEILIPGKGKGEARLESLRLFLELIYDEFSDLGSFEELWARVKGFVAKLVGVWNSFKLLGNDDDEAPPTTPIPAKK